MKRMNRPGSVSERRDRVVHARRWRAGGTVGILPLLLMAPPSSVVALSACFVASPNPAACGQSITFDATCSTADPGRSIVAYGWTFGDGADATAGPTTAHAYSRFGNYDVTLQVT